MAVLPIRCLPDPVLQKRAKRVSVINASIHKLVDDMIDTMRAASGVGLAGPQVGTGLRIIVIGLQGTEVICLINPEIVKKKGERQVDEACLSIPGYHGEVKRAVQVTVKGLSKQKREVRIKGEGLLAQALEHEIDHLNGILFVDRLESPDKLKKVESEELASSAASAGAEAAAQTNQAE